MNSQVRILRTMGARFPWPWNSEEEDEDDYEEDLRR